MWEMGRWREWKSANIAKDEKWEQRYDRAGEQEIEKDKGENPGLCSCFIWVEVCLGLKEMKQKIYEKTVCVV